MLIDFIWLYIHVSVLMVIVIREFTRTENRNLFALVFCGAFLVLVSGQDWWMLSKFEDGGVREMMHLQQTVNLQGVQMANYFTGIAVFFYALTYYFFEKRKVTIAINVKSRDRSNYLSYLFWFCWVMAVGVALVNSAGGIDASLLNPGLNQAYGVTMFLILISLGKFPLMYKIASGTPIKVIDVGLFSIVLLFMIFNARLNVAFISLQLIFLINYCRNEIPRRLLFIVPFIMFAIFIVFGLYREFATHAEGVINTEVLFDFFVNYADMQTTLDWFYAANVEGFAGLAGILTFASNVGGIQFDIGFSNLSFITQFIPGSLRNDPSLPFLEFTKWLVNIYPYRNGSLIPSGLEMAYGNFGFLGIVLFGGILGYLTQFLHNKMLNAKNDRLKMGVLSVQIIHAIRGPFSNVIFFALSDLIMLLFYRVSKAIFRFPTRRLGFSIKAMGNK